jgi:hypothetical protein
MSFQDTTYEYEHIRGDTVLVHVSTEIFMSMNVKLLENGGNDLFFRSKSTHSGVFHQIISRRLTSFDKYIEKLRVSL